MLTLLHRLYPASFRNEYGAELRRVFEKRRRETSGAIGVTLLWLGEIADVVMNATGVHLDILRQDLRHTTRSLGRAKGFTAAALVVTALGVGATTAAFSVMDHVMIRPLPFAEPSRLVKIWQKSPEYARIDVSPANYRDWKAASTSFVSTAAYSEGETINLLGVGDPARLNGSLVMGDLVGVLGVKPLRGRTFSPEDSAPNADCSVIISHSLWRARFNADPATTGRHVNMNGEPCAIIGIMPASFLFPSRTIDVWVPARFDETIYQDRSNQFLRVMARLKPGVSIDQARTELSSIAARLEQQYPKDNAKVGATIIQLRDEVGQLSKVALYTLVGAALCVLLIACTNLASLLVARASSRDRELSLRTALGAGRERLVRQLLTESLVLALTGGLLGVALAINIVPLVIKLVPTSLPIAEQPGLDGRMLLMAFAVTMVTGLAFGVLPALRASRQSDALKDGARTGVSRRSERVRGVLVISQVAVSVVLLVGAGLMIRALWKVQQVDPGFKTANVLTMRTTLPMPKYGPQAQRVAFYRHVLDDVRAQPGVVSAAYTSWAPIAFRGGIWPVFLPGQSHEPAGAPTVSVRYVTSDFFSAMSVPVRIGRPFVESDSVDAQKVVVVSEDFVARHFPGQDPRGKQIFVALFDRTIVGVVGNVRVRGLERESEPQVYLPYQQQLDNMMTFYTPKDLVIRMSDDSRTADLTAAVRAIVNKADPELPITDVRTLATIVETDLQARQSQVNVLIIFAGVACLLAAVGLHGLLAFVVSARTREIGVRLALGASPRQVLWLVTQRGGVLAIVGVVIGGVLAFFAGRSMEALLAGVEPSDVVAMSFAIGVTLVSALVGTMMPALRASRIAPTEALRAD